MEFFGKGTREQIDYILNRHNEIMTLIDAPEVLADHKLTARLNKEMQALEGVVVLYQQFSKLFHDYNEYNDNYDELSSQFEDALDKEIVDLRERLQELADKIIRKVAYMNASKESVLFFAKLISKGDSLSVLKSFISSYVNFCTKEGWECSNLDCSQSNELALEIVGDNVKTLLQKEVGVHIIKTLHDESQIQVIVIDDVTYPSVNIKEDDIKIGCYRASGAGGQHINTTDSAVRIKHLPTGITVTCQEERSQLQNKQKALERLQTKVNDHYSKVYTQEVDNKKRAALSNLSSNNIIRVIDCVNGEVKDLKDGKVISFAKFKSGFWDELMY